MSEPVRIGVIGAGSVSQQMHLPYLRELDDRFELIGVCDASRTLAEAAGAPLATTSVEELLAAQPDAVLIAVNGPADELVVQAIQADAHVLVEKPLAWTVGRGRAVEAAASAAGRIALVAYMKRYDPAVELAEQAVASMGPVRGGLVRCVAGPNELYIDDVARILRADDVPQATRERIDAITNAGLVEAIGDLSPELTLAFRLLVGITCHELSVLRGLLGAPVEISAARVWDRGKWYSATLRYDAFSLDYLLGRMTTRTFDERVELYSDDEALELSFPSPFLKNAPTLLTRRRDTPDGSLEERAIGSYEEAFKRELEHFHDCIANGAEPRTPAWEGRADAEIMTAVIAAAVTGEPQALSQQEPARPRPTG